jgi:hypothetical protein
VDFLINYCLTLNRDCRSIPRNDATIGDFVREAEKYRDGAALSLKKAHRRVDLMEEIRRRVGRDDVFLPEALTRRELRELALAWGGSPHLKRKPKTLTGTYDSRDEDVRKPSTLIGRRDRDIEP